MADILPKGKGCTGCTDTVGCSTSTGCTGCSTSTGCSPSTGCTGCSTSNGSSKLFETSPTNSAVVDAQLTSKIHLNNILLYAF